MTDNGFGFLVFTEQDAREFPDGVYQTVLEELDRKDRSSIDFDTVSEVAILCKHAARIGLRDFCGKRDDIKDLRYSISEMETQIEAAKAWLKENA